MARYREPVVVLGLGRFGTALALELASSGTEVLAVDSRAAVVQRLAGQLSQVVVADSTDPEALKEIGVPGFHRAVVAIGNDQQASILTTAVLEDLAVDDIWAKAMDSQHAKILRRVGAHHVVLPEHEMGERVAHLVSGRLQDYIEIDDDWVFATTRPPKEATGVALGESNLRRKHGITVVSVKPEGEASFTYAGTATRLGYGDQIVIAGHPRDVERFVDRL